MTMHAGYQASQNASSELHLRSLVEMSFASRRVTMKAALHYRPAAVDACNPPYSTVIVQRIDIIGYQTSIPSHLPNNVVRYCMSIGRNVVASRRPECCLFYLTVQGTNITRAFPLQTAPWKWNQNRNRCIDFHFTIITIVIPTLITYESP
jgi:hypothetical protein